MTNTSLATLDREMSIFALGLEKISPNNSKTLNLENVSPNN